MSVDELGKLHDASNSHTPTSYPSAVRDLQMDRNEIRSADMVDSLVQGSWVNGDRRLGECGEQRFAACRALTLSSLAYSDMPWQAPGVKARG